MRGTLEKSVATAFDFVNKQELSTEGILYNFTRLSGGARLNGVPFVCLAADESFPSYLGVRAMASWHAPPPAQAMEGGFRPQPYRGEDPHVFCQELVGVAKRCEAGDVRVLERGGM